MEMIIGNDTRVFLDNPKVSSKKLEKKVFKIIRVIAEKYIKPTHI
jgi:hypothetical protein